MKIQELTEALTTPYNFDTFHSDVTQLRKYKSGKKRPEQKLVTATFFTSEGNKYKVIAKRVGYTKADRERIAKANAEADDLTPFHFEYESGGIWEVHFALIDTDEEGKEIGRNDRAGTGDALRVFATVFKFIDKLNDHKYPSILSLKAKVDDPQRGRLYKKMAQRYASQIGLKVTGDKAAGDKYRIELRRV